MHFEQSLSAGHGFLCLLLLMINGVHSLAEEREFRSSERLTLGTLQNRSASVRVADFNGDQQLDLVIANGRHWPQPNYVFLNQGRARFSVQRDLGTSRSTSYAAEPADVDQDGDLDIVVGNDMAPNQVYLNDGGGHFKAGQRFGDVSSVRSITVTDLNQDGRPDVLVTCRGRSNRFYLNQGGGRFDSGTPFGSATDSTIDVAVADWNGDDHLDLILANRDNQRNSILINDGHLGFGEGIPFGEPNQQTRAVAVADLNRDGHLDIVTGNIGSPNSLAVGDGKGGFHTTTAIGLPNGRTYCVAVADMDNDDDLDLVFGNVGQENTILFNENNASAFSRKAFGSQSTATYGLDVGDLDGDGYLDIVVANSDATNQVFLNRSPTSDKSSRTAAPPVQHVGIANSEQWPSFRGNAAKGVAEGYRLPTTWNADPSSNNRSGVLWSTRVPGLGHSSPVVQGDRIFLLTAIAKDGPADLMVGKGGKPDAADDNGTQSWVALCYDRLSGKELWRKTLREGSPRATRHAKATHANSTLAINGDHVVAMLGSEGLHCFSLDGELKWSRDLGIINISKYGIGWGYASSPAIANGQVTVVCDDPDGPYIASFGLDDGNERWRTSRAEICERSWGTPLIHQTKDRSQLVVNGWPWIVSYDHDSGKELWRIRGGGDNPVPTPFEARGHIYITNAHGAQSPIYVVSPNANGDITPSENDETAEANDPPGIVWSKRRGGSYMSTPVVYGDYLYLGNTNGIVRCFHAKTGELAFEKRLGSGAAITASLVAGDGKIYLPSENGSVYVLRAGSEFELLSTNEMGAPCFATPAISRGTIYVRTTKRLFAISR